MSTPLTPQDWRALAIFRPWMSPTIPQLRQAEVTTVEANGVRSRARGEDAMTTLSFIRLLSACAAVACSALFAAPAAACENGRCEAGTQVAQTKPLKLKTFMRKPVATSATRTVKKKNGEYAKTAIKRRSKQPAATPQVTQETISPAAAQAFASYELARVRVVTPEETGGASLFAESVATAPPNDAATPAPNDAVIDGVQIVSADEINDIDRKVDSPSAVSLDTLSRELATSAEPKAADDSWLQQMLMVLGGAFAAAAAMVKILVG
jgi:hypothetical protein